MEANAITSVVLIVCLPETKSWLLRIIRRPHGLELLTTSKMKTADQLYGSRSDQTYLAWLKATRD